MSMYAAWTTTKFNRKQRQLIESQERLNKLMLEREASEAANAKKADLGASFIKVGSNNHRLKIWNRGKVEARNVTLELLEGNTALIQSDIDAKFPLEVLDTHQSVELIAAIYMSGPSKHPFKLIWSDDFSEYNERIVYPTT